MWNGPGWDGKGGMRMGWWWSGEEGGFGAGDVERKGGIKKRPSVETEGRLTIACHMKILKRSMLLVAVCLIHYSLSLSVRPQK